MFALKTLAWASFTVVLALVVYASAGRPSAPTSALYEKAQSETWTKREREVVMDMVADLEGDGMVQCDPSLQLQSPQSRTNVELSFWQRRAALKAQRTKVVSFLQAALSQFQKGSTRNTKLARVNLPSDGQAFVVGDLHGQFWQLRAILDRILTLSEPRQGLPRSSPSKLICNRKVHYIFLGDYVDRGSGDVPLLLLLLGYRALCPDSVTLLRGNHEDLELNHDYGFSEVARQSGLRHDKNSSDFLEAFYTLPFAATLAKEGSPPMVFLTHGGVTKEMAKIKSTDANSWVDQWGRTLEAHPDFASCDTNSAACKMMWSDPLEGEGWRKKPDKLTGMYRSAMGKVTGFEMSSRGIGMKFSATGLKAFANNAKIPVVIRGHQAKDTGWDLQSSGASNILTVFSASRTYPCAMKHAIDCNEESSEDGIKLPPEESGVPPNWKGTTKAFIFSAFGKEWSVGSFLMLEGSDLAANPLQHAVMQVFDANYDKCDNDTRWCAENVSEGAFRCQAELIKIGLEQQTYPSSSFRSKGQSSLLQKLTHFDRPQRFYEALSRNSSGLACPALTEEDVELVIKTSQKEEAEMQAGDRQNKVESMRKFDEFGEGLGHVPEEHKHEALCRLVSERHRILADLKKKGAINTMMAGTLEQEEESRMPKFEDTLTQVARVNVTVKIVG